MKTIDLNIGLITFSTKDTSTNLENLTEIISNLFKETYVIIAGTKNPTLYNKITYYIEIPHKTGITRFRRIYRFILAQIKISIAIIKNLNKINLWILYDAPILLLPLITIKLFNRRSIQLISISTDKSLNCRDCYPSLVNSIIKYIGDINLKLVDWIFIYSERLVFEWGLEQYKNKIFNVSHHFVNKNYFNIKIPYNNRSCIVGFMGRLSFEKGIMNFLESIELIVKEKKNVRFIIGGDGPLKNELNIFLKENHLDECVDFVGWIPHDQLPSYLNRLKLLVIPSFTESGPLIMIEAISCGVPILGTPVGNIPNVIEDSKTGFIMEDNTPECIAYNVIRALDSPNLNQISQNSFNFVAEEYNRNKAIEKYRSAFNNINL